MSSIDLGDGFGRRHVVVRGQHAQRRHVLAEQLSLPVAELAPVQTVAVRPLEQRVVDVGDVLYVVHAVPGIQPHSMNQVERQVGRGVPQMGGVVRRDAADVHGRRLPRRHRPHLAISTVEEAKLGATARQLRNVRRRPRFHAFDSRASGQYSDRMASSSVPASSWRHIRKSGR